MFTDLGKQHLSGNPHAPPFSYRLWDHKVVSDFDLGEIDTASDHDCLSGTLRLCLSAESGWPRPEGQPAIEERYESGEPRYQCWKSGSAYLARFAGVCSFLIRPDQVRIECAPAPGLADSTIAHLLLDYAIPHLLAFQPGHLVLHACAIQVEGHTVVVLGESGRGKSTLGAWFAAQGYPLLTDDCLILRFDERSHRWLAQPSYQSVRLWPDSADALGLEPAALREFAGSSSKRRTARDADLHFASEGSPLSACFVLAPPANSSAAAPAQLAIHPLSVSEAFLAVAQAVFRLDVQDERINRGEFEVLTGLLETVRFYSLAYERKYDSLPSVQRAIIQTILA